MARKYFGKDNPLGQEILFGSNMSLLVTGVIEELPENSFLSSLCLVPITVAKELGWEIDRWGGGNFDTYVQLEKNIDHEALITQIRDFYEKHAENWVPSKLSIRPITKIHLYALNGGGPIVYVYIFSGMTLFILLLAIVNFVNLSTARSVRRAKEIGVRKIVGAYRHQLTKQILMESILITILSGVLAMFFAYALLPALNQLTEAHMTFSFSRTMILYIAAIVILTGIISGAYPAFILSRLQPVRAVKGGMSPGKGNMLFRKILIGFQFSLSIFMIIAMFGVNRQLKYLNTKDLGYNRENIISIGLAREISSQYPVVRTELMRNPEIVTLTRSSSRLDKAYTTTGDDAVTWEGKSSEKQMPQTHLMRVDPEFLETFKIDMVDGRFFSREFPHDRTESVVINETTLRTMELKSPIGKRISVWGRDFRIIGVIKDFHFYSLHEKIQPLILINRYAGFKEIFVRINSQNLSEILDFIKNKLKEIVPGYVPHIKFFDENLNSVYVSEQRMEKLTTYFSALAIFISYIGLLGLVSFAVKQRTKEIAIRKVLGASEGKIAGRLLNEILICVVVANVVVYPVAFFVLRGWLDNYAYHTTLGVGMFILASVLTVALAFLSVGWNVLKASLANPVDSLRFE
jgi:putative ABC transport system permease protein